MSEEKSIVDWKCEDCLHYVYSDDTGNEYCIVNKGVLWGLPGKRRCELIEYQEKGELEARQTEKALYDAYFRIYGLLQKYCDMKKEYYNIVALWILGTWIHKDFQTYPYLFFNAMKGSGKTRTLNLIAHLSKNGEKVVSMSEAVLFRSAKESTFCIDELEGIGRKDKSALRELLNAAYKKGTNVKRARKVKEKNQERYEIETFEVFCPIAMANIWGMEDVLSDRCITLILEKSKNPRITRLMEDFAENEEIKGIIASLSVVMSCRCQKKVYTCIWNKKILEYYNIMTLNTHIHSLPPLTSLETTTLTNDTNSQKTDIDNDTLFDKVMKTKIDSRHLELFFPLFVIASSIDEAVVDETINSAETIIKTKQEEDAAENKDVALLDFIAGQESTADFLSLSDLAAQFRGWLKEDEESTWINNKWLGRALKRLALVIEKKRTNEGRKVILDFGKARQQITLFKEISVTVPQDIVVDWVKLETTHLPCTICRGLVVTWEHKGKLYCDACKGLLEREKEAELLEKENEEKND